MIRTRFIPVVGLLGGGLLPASLAAPASAETYTFGSTLPPPTSGYYDSCAEACTTAQISLPGRR